MYRTSAAYNLDTFVDREQPKTHVRVARTSEKNNSKSAFSTRITAFLVLIAVLMIATVYSRMTLSETRSMINSGNSRLKTLESENAYLSYQLDSLVSLDKAEDYAVNTLGLVKMGSGQIEYVNLQREDVIVSEQRPAIADGAASWLNTLIRFFGG